MVFIEVDCVVNKISITMFNTILSTGDNLIKNARKQQVFVLESNNKIKNVIRVISFLLRLFNKLQFYNIRDHRIL